MVIFNDGVPVVSTGVIVSLDYVKANSIIVASDIVIQSLIDAATDWLLHEKRYYVYLLTGPYPVSLQMAITKMCQNMFNLTNRDNTLASESLGDYSYSLGQIRQMIDMEISTLLSPWVKRSIPQCGIGTEE